MSTKATPQQLREYIDDLDAVVRASVAQDNFKAVFPAELNRINHLMQVSSESRDDPALLAEIKTGRYIWTAIGSWFQVRNDATKHNQFYKEQSTKMAEFDKKNPGYIPPAPLTTNQRPRLPVQPMGLIVAKGSTPRFPGREPAHSPAPPFRPLPPPFRPIIAPKTATQAPAPESSNHRRKDIPAPQNRRSPSPRYINRFAALTQEMPDDIYDDKDAEGSDDDVQPAATMRKDKGKEKTVEDDEDPHARIKVKSVRDPDNVVQKRLPPVNTGKQRSRVCKRCARLDRPCFVQAGSSLACVDCAKVKMKCVDPSGDEMEVDIPQAKAPATTKKTEPARAKKTAETMPAPLANNTAPKKKRAPKKKTAPALERSDDNDAAGNIPVRAPKKKTAPALERSDDNDAAGNIPVRAPKKKTAPALERSDDNDAAGNNPVRAPKKKLAPAPAPLDTGGKNRKVVKSNEYIDVTDSDEEDVPTLKKRAPKKMPAFALADEQSDNSDAIVEVKNRVQQKAPAPAPALPQSDPMDPSGSKKRKVDVTNSEDDVVEEKTWKKFEKYADYRIGRLEGKAQVFDAALDNMEGPVEFVRDNIDELEAALDSSRDFRDWQKAQLMADEVRAKELDNLQRKINSQDQTIKKLEQRLERAFGFVTNLFERPRAASSQVIDVDAELLPAPMTHTPPAPIREEVMASNVPRAGDITVPANATAPLKSYIEAGIQVVEPKKLYADIAIQAQEMAPAMVPEMPFAVEHVDLPPTLPFALPSSVAPAPTSSHIPSVNLLPPTPSMSQDATTSTATALLEVPVPSLITDAPSELRSRSTTRSRSRSPVAEVRRSPRLTSPAPPNKRPASDPLDDDRASKKSKEQ